jgi:hypothetical protein
MRGILVLGAAALVASAGASVTSSQAKPARCAATTVDYGPAKHPTLGELPWVLARPQTDAVLGFLVSYQRTLRDGRVNDSDGLVLWRTGERIVWTIREGPLTLVGRRLDGRGSFRTRLAASADGFVSEPRFPSSGCWRLTVGSASVVARVVSRPGRAGCDATRAAGSGLTLARPRSAGIAGGFTWRTDDDRLLLYTHGQGPGGFNAKVPWWSRRGHGSLELTGMRLDREGRFRQELQEAGTAQYAAGYHAVFPSIVDVPAPGCWLLRLRVGLDAAVLVVLARDR